MHVIFSATTAPNMLIAAANKGNADAMYWLANCMYFGENGFRVDTAESNRWLKKAIELGHSQAQADYPQWFPVVSNVQSPKDIALKKLLSNFDSIRSLFWRKSQTAYLRNDSIATQLSNTTGGSDRVLVKTRRLYRHPRYLPQDRKKLPCKMKMLKRP